MDLVGDRSTTGEQVHDANVVAVALAYQASVIVADHTRHFSRFAGSITVEGLGAASA